MARSNNALNPSWLQGVINGTGPAIASRINSATGAFNKVRSAWEQIRTAYQDNTQRQDLNDEANRIRQDIRDQPRPRYSRSDLAREERAIRFERNVALKYSKTHQKNALVAIGVARREREAAEKNYLIADGIIQRRIKNARAMVLNQLSDEESQANAKLDARKADYENIKASSPIFSFWPPFSFTNLLTRIENRWDLRSAKLEHKDKMKELARRRRGRIKGFLFGGGVYKGVKRYRQNMEGQRGALIEQHQRILTPLMERERQLKDNAINARERMNFDARAKYERKKSYIDSEMREVKEDGKWRRGQGLAAMKKNAAAVGHGLGSSAAIVKQMAAEMAESEIHKFVNDSAVLRDGVQNVAKAAGSSVQKTFLNKYASLLNRMSRRPAAPTASAAGSGPSPI